MSEPEEDIDDFYDDDDDLLVVKLDEDDDDNDQNGNDDDDEQYYRPFRHQTTAATTEKRQMAATTASDPKHSGSKTKMKSNGNNRSTTIKKEDATNYSPGVDLLALLLLDETELRGQGGGEGEEGANTLEMIPNDIASLVRDASAKSQRARSLTYTLAGEGQQPSNPSGAKSSEKAEAGTTIDNDEGKDKDKLYAAAADAHAEAALSYRRVYQTLFGMLSPSSSEALPESLSSSTEVPKRRRRRRWRIPSGGGFGGEELRNNEWELAKSMLMLSDMHARTAKSLYGMGLKWNMMTPTADKADDDGDGGGGGGSKTVKDAVGVGTTSGHKAKTTVEAAALSSKNVPTSLSPYDDKKKSSISDNNASHASANNKTDSTVASAELVEILPPPLPPQHERLRMAVRRALDTANHEEDITNSTFLGKSSSTSTAVTKQSTPTITSNNHNGTAKRSNKNKVAMIAAAGRVAGGLQPQNHVKGGENDGGVNPVDEL